MLIVSPATYGKIHSVACNFIVTELLVSLDEGRRNLLQFF